MSPGPDPAVGNLPDLASIEVVTVMQALSDPVRLDMVKQLAGCPERDGLTCGQIEVPVSKSTTTHHLKVLLAAGIISEREEGNRKYVRLRRDELDQRFPGLISLILRPKPDSGS
ncbi:MAG TPA: winged helix-turn-helix domain-containing protein [Acidimicrobiales bacterium]|nr:winged helix-turn-helix domain-containing protein [Acidimicrobiales bacterium]